MDEEKVSTGEQVIATLKQNQKEIIKTKEKYYDRLIDSLHLTTRALDIFIVLLIVFVIVVFVTQSH